MFLTLDIDLKSYVRFRFKFEVYNRFIVKL